jgi:hypothetical protein
MRGLIRHGLDAGYAEPTTFSARAAVRGCLGPLREVGR